MTIRNAIFRDLKRIVKIHNQAIEKRCYTGIFTPHKYEDRIKWFKFHETGKYPLLVAETGNEIAGWISAEPYREGREAFFKTCEVSYWVDEKFRNQGIGNALLHELIIKTREQGFKTIMALTFHTNEVSNNMLKKHGFQEWGRFPDLGEINGQPLDHMFFGLKL